MKVSRLFRAHVLSGVVMASLASASAISISLFGAVAAARGSKDLMESEAAKTVEVSVQTGALYDPALKKAFDQNGTNMALWIGNKDIDGILESLGPDARDSTELIVNFNLKFSVVPFLVRDSSQEQVNKKIDAVIAQKRGEIYEVVSQKVNAALAQDPRFNGLPPAAQEQLRARTLQTALAAADAQLEEVRNQKKKDVSKRLDKIELETSIQEVSIVLGKVVKGGQAIMYVKAGKFHIHNGPKLNLNNRSSLEVIRAGTSSQTQRAGSVAAGAAVSLGTNYRLTNDKQLRIDTFFTHERMPFISGQQFVTGAVSLEPREFDEHRMWWRIDTAVLRTLFSSERGDVYFAFGSYDNDTAVQTGFSYRISKSGTVHYDHYQGDRPYLKEGDSLFYVHSLTSKLDLYAGIERLEDSYQPTKTTRADGKVTATERTVGVSYLILQKQYGSKNNPVRLAARVNLEGVDESSNDRPKTFKDKTVRARAQLEVRH